jgi:alpha-mannosidase
MSSRELVVLTPYRFPAQNPLMLSSEDSAALLNAYSALWHPAALPGATGPPRLGSPYDYEKPIAGHVYALPETPPLVLPDDWDQRVRDAGAIAFRASADRQGTLANLQEALRSSGTEADAWFDLPAERLAPFFAIGFGLRMVETLFEAMEHENVLSVTDLWLDVQQALSKLRDADPDISRGHLQKAAELLLQAREVVYPVNIFLLDLCALENWNPELRLPTSFERAVPLNLLMPASVLEQLGRDAPELLAKLRARAHEDLVEVCGGPYIEREDALLPVASQLWNLLKGLAAYRRLLDQEVHVFARTRFAAHPQLPLLLNSVGIQRAILVAFDEAVLPTYRATVINWPSPDGKQVEAFTRAPYTADNPQTYFHWAHYLHKTIAQDHSATLALLHRGTPAGVWYEDLLELSRLAPVFGQWMTLSRYLSDVMAGEYAAAASADEYHGDYLTERTAVREPQPVSGFARHIRLRRRLDTAWTLAGLSRGLMGRNDPLRLDERLTELEDRIESRLETGDLEKIEQEAGVALAARLLVRAQNPTPGYLLLNPCSFARRAALELEGFAGPLPLGGPVKACQVDDDRGRLVVEVPALGFAWIPRSGDPNATAPVARMRLADANHVRNEFFEAEIDPATGGLRAYRDHRTRVNRLGQQLVFNPGSTMKAREVKITSAGPALGEIVSEGAILDEEQKQVLALFRQRFRAWLGRPVLELRIDIHPQQPPVGYPWHSYFGARFAWRDERTTLLRGVNGTSYVTTSTRPETPDYLEFRLGQESTVLLPGGLPFHQRHGARMVDVLLVPEGETTHAFELGLALARDYPAQTALGMVTPVPLVPVAKGPPHIGAAGWLFHLTAPNLVLSSIRPVPDGADAVVAQMLECTMQTASAELRCVRDPARAQLQDALGTSIQEAFTHGDTVQFEVAPGDLTHLRIEFE